MTTDHSERTISGSPFYPRTSQLNQRQKWNAWDRYHIVDFYTDWKAEHALIRSQAAALDMTPLAKHYVFGPDAERFVDYIITRDATKMQVGQIYFTPWCNEDGIQVGDGMVFRLEEDRFLFSADPMMRWFNQNAADLDVAFEDATHEFGILALQGPMSREVLEAATGEDWSDFRFSRLRHTTIGGVEVLAARQGFTGEHGYELWVRSDDGVTMWDGLFDAGASYGLGVAGNHAADVARIEAGLVIPGCDYTPAAIDPGGDWIPQSSEYQVTPLELDMGRLVDFTKQSDFVGRKALEAERRSGSRRIMVGLVVNWQEILDAYVSAGVPPEITPRVVRQPMPIYHDGERVGRTTSVTWSPTVGKVIGFAHVGPEVAAPGTEVTVDWLADGLVGSVSASLVELPHFQLKRAAKTS